MALSISLALAFGSTLGAAQEPIARAPSDGVGRDPVVSGWSTFWWDDYDADGLVDAFVLLPGGQGRLLKNGGQGQFDDVTEASGTAGTSGVHMALWRDFDRDGRSDLFLASYGGASRLMRQARAGTFLDVTEQAGLQPRLDPIDAEWIDPDADGLFDLRVTTLEGDWIFQNRGEARFEPVDLGLSAGDPMALVEMPATVEEARRLRGLGASAASRPVGGEHLPFGEEDSTSAAGSSSFEQPGGSTEEGGSCASTIEDQASPGVCLPASSVPTLGSLFPISSQFYISSSNGFVGVGTTNPGAKLDVVGGHVRTSGRLISTAVAGPPLAVSSSTVVTNLNADLLDGISSSAFSQLGTLIEAGEIAAGAVTTGKLAANAVNSAKIVDNGIASADLAGNSVTTAKIMDGTVTVGDLANNSVSAAQIQLGAVGTPEIADGVIVDEDVSPAAAIAGTKIVPSFGYQNVVTLGGGRFEGQGQIYGGEFKVVSQAGVGVHATSSNPSTTTRGVYGQVSSPLGKGVAGDCFASSGTGTGVYGSSTALDGRGVHGRGNTAAAGYSVGVFGETLSPIGYGVYGFSSSTTGFNLGVVGESASPGGYAVYSAGNFTASGTKSFIQPHPLDASKEIRFVCLEGNESGTYFRGSTQLVGGIAVIEVPEEFRLVSEATNITVQITARGPSADLYVESESLDEIVVRGRLDVRFDYFVNGVRRGYSDFQVIGENQGFRPRRRGMPFGTQYPAAIRQILIDNGTLNPDLTPNEATAERLGWRLVEPDAEPVPPAREPIAPSND